MSAVNPLSDRPAPRQERSESRGIPLLHVSYLLSLIVQTLGIVTPVVTTWSVGLDGESAFGLVAGFIIAGIVGAFVALVSVRQGNFSGALLGSSTAVICVPCWVLLYRGSHGLLLATGSVYALVATQLGVAALARALGRGDHSVALRRQGSVPRAVTGRFVLILWVALLVLLGLVYEGTLGFVLVDQALNL